MIVKAPQRKVLKIAFKLPLDWSVRHPGTLIVEIGRTNHLLELYIPDKVVVSH